MTDDNRKGAAGGDVASALRRAARVSADAGAPDPNADARRLVAFALGREPGDARPLDPAAPLDAAKAALLEGALVERRRRRPVSQIVGGRAFYDHVFEVTSDVLDPRPESERLVEAALEALAPGAAASVLDLGVGSGCLLLSVLAARPNAHGVGMDRSAAALAVARRNAQALGVAERARFVQGDWHGDWPALIGGAFDVVLCNPPYIAADAWRALAPEVRLFEPVGALTPGPDGLAAYRAIAERLDAALAPGASAIFEIGRTQSAEASALFSEAGWRVQVLADLGGAPRALSVAR